MTAKTTAEILGINDSVHGADWVITVSTGCESYSGPEILSGPHDWHNMTCRQAQALRSSIERETGRIMYLQNVASLRT